MSVRFRQTFTLFPGVRLNVGKRGISASFGVPGATVNLSARGLRATVGVPGSGVSYSTMLFRAGGAAPSDEPGYWRPPETPAATSGASSRGMEIREIGSAPVEDLTSAALLNFRAMVTDADRQRREIEADLSAVRDAHRVKRGDLIRRRDSLFRPFHEKRIAGLGKAVRQLVDEIEQLEEWLAATHIEVKFDAEKPAQDAFLALGRAYEGLRGCAFAWDVTGARRANQIAERTSAYRIVERLPVGLSYGASDLIRFDGRAMGFANANGEDILIFPGVILMQRADRSFALLDLREVSVEHRNISFIEAEEVPADAEVIDYTWDKVNKDGSPDRRFLSNHRIPICRYGRLTFRSPTGLFEEYQFSNAAAALAFCAAFNEYKSALGTIAANSA